jgi:hypothetical protein
LPVTPSRPSLAGSILWLGRKLQLGDVVTQRTRPIHETSAFREAYIGVARIDPQVLKRRVCGDEPPIIIVVI